METTEQPDTDYLIVTDTWETILADSDPLGYHFTHFLFQFRIFDVGGMQ
jgi:hypothetical protein